MTDMCVLPSAGSSSSLFSPVTTGEQTQLHDEEEERKEDADDDDDSMNEFDFSVQVAPGTSAGSTAQQGDSMGPSARAAPALQGPAARQQVVVRKPLAPLHIGGGGSGSRRPRARAAAAAAAVAAAEVQAGLSQFTSVFAESMKSAREAAEQLAAQAREERAKDRQSAAETAARALEATAALAEAEHQHQRAMMQQCHQQ